jgi:O-methyltransferase involved in polyketide biosynthesis
MTKVATNSFDLISPTALSAAYCRQLSDIPYALEIAQLVDSKSFTNHNDGNQTHKRNPMLMMAEARYKAVNHLITKYGYPQIIELASGLLPRGMVMSANPNITFVESDLPNAIAFKQQLVNHLIGQRPNLHFEAIEVTSRPSQFPIHADYLNNSQKVAILCEGLLSYLTFPEKEHLCANVREMLQHYGGVWITPDLYTKEEWHRMEETSPAAQERLQSISTLTGRAVVDNSFNNLKHAEQFFIEQGFCVEAYKMSEIMGELTCLKHLGFNRDEAQHFFSIGSVFAMHSLKLGEI